jgi:hypothetical protein
MEDVKINTSKTVSLALGADPDSSIVNATLYHEFSNSSVVQASTACTRTAAGNYSIVFGESTVNSNNFVLSQGGAHKVVFSYDISSVAYTSEVYFNVCTPYITGVTFFTNHSDLQNTFGSKFEDYERKARRVINTYCGQDFDYYGSKSFIIDGYDTRFLRLPYPLDTLTSVVADFGDSDAETIHDSSDTALNNLEKFNTMGNFGSSYTVRFKNKVSDTSTNYIARTYSNKFNSKSDYKVTGNFGWRYVPNNIRDACELLILDLMNDDSEFRRHRIHSVDMDTTRYRFERDFYGSTGNTDADVLLMDYTYYVMDYIG